MNQPTSFGFPGQGAPRPAPFGAPFQPPAQPQAPAQPAAPAERSFWAFINGQSTLISEAQARTLPPSTPAMPQDQQGGWSTVGALLPAQAVLAPAPAPAFHAPAPAASPLAPTAQSQPWNPAVNPAAAPPQVHYGQPPQQHGAYPAPANAAAAVPQGLFSGASNASASRSGTTMEEGDYIVRWCGAEYKLGQGQNVGKSWVIHDVEVIISSYLAGDPVRGKCNQVGTHCSVFVTRNQSFDGNTKEIALALMPRDAQGNQRTDASFISEQELGQMLLSPSPLEGTYCLIEARKKPTRATPQKPEGGEFTKISWWHCPTGADGMPDTARIVR